MAHGIKRRIRAALDLIHEEIRGNAQGGKYGAGLSSEGYAGGYRDALYDVTLLLNGAEPGDRGGRRYWRTERTK